MTPIRYIFVKDNGDSFVTWGHTLLEALNTTNPPGCPCDKDILAVVTDYSARIRKGSWHTYATKLKGADQR